MTIEQYKNWSQKEGLKPSLGSTLIQYKKTFKMQLKKEKNVIEKLAFLCLEELKKQNKTLNHVLKRKESNPFPIGKTNLERLIYKKELSVPLQIKLAKYFELKLKIILE